ncbi:MAG: peptidoglycan DD-metalloendopeptidase family protein [Succinivibrionaceae bacterium]|nr:peptidoglycan DD-metalloendopeptidase family protein [Succinivibrionaceae bacterium]
MLKRLSLLFIVCAVAVSGCSVSGKYRHRGSAYGSNHNKASAMLSSDQYMVKAGDTLFSIAFVHGIDYRTLALINNLDPDKSIIHPGDILTVKIKGLNSKNVYRVRSGDTLYSIARRNHTSIHELARINRLSPPYAINLGQLLILDSKKKVFDRVSSHNIQVAAVTPKPQTTVQGKQASSPSVDDKPEVVSNNRKEYNSQSRLTWKWPTNGTIIHNFSKNGSSNGIDIAGKKGQNIVSAASGKVVYAGSALRGYGNLIIIKHNDDYLSAYAHNDQLLVKETQKVKAGQVIARMGDTDSDRVNLHFEIRYRGEAVNPALYLPKK